MCDSLTELGLEMAAKHLHSLSEPLAQDGPVLRIAPVPHGYCAADQVALQQAFDVGVSFQWKKDGGRQPPEITLSLAVAYFKTRLKDWGVDADALGISDALRNLFAPRIAEYSSLGAVPATITAFSIKRHQSLILSLRFNSPPADLTLPFGDWAKGVLNVQDLGLTLEFKL